jgi:hypothetical protein
MFRTLLVTAGLVAAAVTPSPAAAGPFYPYPQVPLGWRKVQLEGDESGSGYRPQFYFHTVDVTGDGVLTEDDYLVWDNFLRGAEYLGEFEGADFYSTDVDEDGIADLVAFVPDETGPMVLVWIS